MKYYVIYKNILNGGELVNIPHVYTTSLDIVTHIETNFTTPFNNWVSENLTNLENNVINLSTYFTESNHYSIGWVSNSYVSAYRLGLNEIFNIEEL